MSKRWEQFQVGSLAAVIRRLYTYLLPIYTTVEQVDKRSDTCFTSPYYTPREICTSELINTPKYKRMLAQLWFTATYTVP